MIHVVGARAIGSFLAARLAQSGQDILLVARGRRAESVKRDGIALQLDERVATIGVPVVDVAEPLPQADQVILCVKTPDLAEALKSYSALEVCPAVFVTVQNGVDAPELVRQCFPSPTLLAARVHGFFEQTDGLVRHVGVEPSLYFGVWQGAAPGVAMDFLDRLTRAGITGKISDTIEVELWAKLMLTSALGGVSAALDLPAGRVLYDPTGKSMLECAMCEVAALADRCGVTLPDDSVVETMRFVTDFPADATTSLHRDLAAGRPSEFASLVGTVLRLARARGCAVPVHQAIVARLVERGYLKTEPT